MRRFHLWFGALGILVFVVSGAYMRLHPLPAAPAYDSLHLLRRSRHIYILASGLIHLMLGLYVEPRPAGWRRSVQVFGSAVLFVSTALLILAFIAEPAQGFQPEMWRSRAGLIMMLLGCVAHVVSSIGVRPRVGT